MAAAYTRPADVYSINGFLKFRFLCPRGIAHSPLAALENAVTVLLSLLYEADIYRPITFKTPPKPDKYSEIYNLYAQGWSVSKLSREYGISKPRHGHVCEIRQRKALKTLIKLAATALTSQATLFAASRYQARTGIAANRRITSRAVVGASAYGIQAGATKASTNWTLL